MPTGIRRVTATFVEHGAKSILSVPAFGQNVYDEREVVVTGNKYRWDARLNAAPKFADVPMREG